MLLEKIDKLNKHYMDINNAQKKNFELKKIQSINTGLRDLLKIFNSIKTVYINVSIDDEYKIGTLFNREPDFKNVIRMIDQLNEKIKNNESITKPEVAKIKSELYEIERPVKDDWEEYFNKNSQNAINLIEMIKPFSEDSDEFVILSYDLKKSKNKWPVSENEILSFKNILLQCEERINKLDISGEIQNFLLKVLNDKATINDLNKNILEWIKKHEFSSKLVINFRK